MDALGLSIANAVSGAGRGNNRCIDRRLAVALADRPGDLELDPPDLLGPLALGRGEIVAELRLVVLLWHRGLLLLPLDRFSIYDYPCQKAIFVYRNCRKKSGGR